MTFKIADLPVSEKPREKAVHNGIQSLSTIELLAILLRTGYKGCSVLDLSRILIQKAGGVSGLCKMSLPELLNIQGIGEAKALELQACFELSRRIALDNVQKKDVLNEPDILIQWLQKEIGSRDQETFMAIYLDARNRLLAHRILFTGTINESFVYPREIFREALVLKASNVIVVHNHPSGECIPSQADVLLTTRLLEAAQIMNVNLYDHLIVSSQDSYSFYKSGAISHILDTIRQNQTNDKEMSM